MTEKANTNMQLKSLLSVARTKHLRSEATPSKCETHFGPRCLRRLTRCYVPESVPPINTSPASQMK